MVPSFSSFILPENLPAGKDPHAGRGSEIGSTPNETSPGIRSEAQDRKQPQGTVEPAHDQGRDGVSLRSVHGETRESGQEGDRRQKDEEDSRQEPEGGTSPEAGTAAHERQKLRELHDPGDHRQPQGHAPDPDTTGIAPSVHTPTLAAKLAGITPAGPDSRP